MKILTKLLQKSRLEKARIAGDPVHDFFVSGSTVDKKSLYEEALRAAQADQKKIIAEYQKTFA